MSKATATGTKPTTDSIERRRVQNRLAQRNYRNNVKQRLRQLEWLDSIVLDSTMHSQKQASMTLQPPNPMTLPLQLNPGISWPQMTDVAQQSTDANSYMFIPSTHGSDTIQLPCPSFLPDLSQQNRVGTMGETTMATNITMSDKTLDSTTQIHAMGSVREYQSIYPPAPNEEKDTSVTNVQSPSAIFRAASHGHTRIVKILLDNGAKLEARDSYGQTLLHIACSRGFDSLVSLLIEEGIDLNAKDDFECTALQIAAERGLEGTVELLVNAGAMIEPAPT